MIMISKPTCPCSLKPERVSAVSSSVIIRQSILHQCDASSAPYSGYAHVSGFKSNTEKSSQSIRDDSVDLAHIYLRLLTHRYLESEAEHYGDICCCCCRHR